MIDLVSKLMGRKAERQRESQSAWASLVVDVADGKLTDPDAILSELDELDRTPEQLAEAVELLAQRREWAKAVEAGPKAERDLQATVKKLEDKDAELHAILEKHEETLKPLRKAKQSALDAIHAMNSARSELRRTANSELQAAAVTDIDEQIATAKGELAELDHAIEDKSRWVNTITENDTAAPRDVALLPSQQSELAKMQQQRVALSKRLGELNGERQRIVDRITFDPSSL